MHRFMFFRTVAEIGFWLPFRLMYPLSCNRKSDTLHSEFYVGIKESKYTLWSALNYTQVRTMVIGNTLFVCTLGNYSWSPFIKVVRFYLCLSYKPSITIGNNASKIIVITTDILYILNRIRNVAFFKDKLIKSTKN